jgi:hypothetical protein
MSPVDPLTVSRKELYELVWSKPMVELAKDFGLSDVAVAKRCRKLGVPVPGRGYWARVAAGQTPRQAPLRKRAEKSTDCSALSFDPPREEPIESKKPVDAPEHDALRAKIQGIQADWSIDLRQASSAVKRTAVHLKRFTFKELVWSHGERTGPLLRTKVSESAGDRALFVCEQLLSCAAKLGWTFRAPPKPKEQTDRSVYRLNLPAVPAFGHLQVEGETLAFRIDERRRQVDHRLTEEEKQLSRRGHYVHPPRWDLLPTGELRLHISNAPDSRYTSRTWKDSRRARLEDQVQSILLGLLDEALRVKLAREQRRQAEIEQRRQEELRWQRSERRAANATLIHELEAQVGAWCRARLLRAYLRALRRAAGSQKIKAKLHGKHVDFIDWAQHYVDQLDPLSSTPHDLDLKANRSGYSSDEYKLRHALSRLIGQRWQDAWKLGKPAPKPIARGPSCLFRDPEDNCVVFSTLPVHETGAHSIDEVQDEAEENG